MLSLLVFKTFFPSRAWEYLRKYSQARLGKNVLKTNKDNTVKLKFNKNLISKLRKKRQIYKPKFKYTSYNTLPIKLRYKLDYSVTKRWLQNSNKRILPYKRKRKILDRKHKGERRRHLKAKREFRKNIRK